MFLLKSLQGPFVFLMRKAEQCPGIILSALGLFVESCFERAIDKCCGLGHMEV